MISRHVLEPSQRPRIVKTMQKKAHRTQSVRDSSAPLAVNLFCSCEHVYDTRRVPDTRMCRSGLGAELSLDAAARPSGRPSGRPAVGLAAEIASAPLINFISVGIHLDSGEFMDGVSRNVKAARLLPWKRGGCSSSRRRRSQKYV